MSVSAPASPTSIERFIKVMGEPPTQETLPLFGEVIELLKTEPGMQRFRDAVLLRKGIGNQNAYAKTDRVAQTILKLLSPFTPPLQQFFHERFAYHSLGECAEARRAVQKVLEKGREEREKAFQDLLLRSEQGTWQRAGAILQVNAGWGESFQELLSRWNLAEHGPFLHFLAGQTVEKLFIHFGIFPDTSSEQYLKDRFVKSEADRRYISCFAFQPVDSFLALRLDIEEEKDQIVWAFQTFVSFQKLLPSDASPFLFWLCVADLPTCQEFIVPSDAQQAGQAFAFCQTTFQHLSGDKRGALSIFQTIYRAKPEEWPHLSHFLETAQKEELFPLTFSLVAELVKIPLLKLPSCLALCRTLVGVLRHQKLVVENFRFWGAVCQQRDQFLEPEARGKALDLLLGGREKDLSPSSLSWEKFLLFYFKSPQGNPIWEQLQFFEESLQQKLSLCQLCSAIAALEGFPLLLDREDRAHFFQLPFTEFLASSLPLSHQFRLFLAFLEHPSYSLHDLSANFPWVAAAQEFVSDPLPPETLLGWLSCPLPQDTPFFELLQELDALRKDLVGKFLDRPILPYPFVKQLIENRERWMKIFHDDLNPHRSLAVVEWLMQSCISYGMQKCAELVSQKIFEHDLSSHVSRRIHSLELLSQPHFSSNKYIYQTWDTEGNFFTHQISFVRSDTLETATFRIPLRLHFGSLDENFWKWVGKCAAILTKEDTGMLNQETNTAFKTLLTKTKQQSSWERFLKQKKPEEDAADWIEGLPATVSEADRFLFTLLIFGNIDAELERGCRGLVPNALRIVKKFILDLKVAYRKGCLFLCKAYDPRPRIGPCADLASRGHLYEDGSLLPSNLYTNLSSVREIFATRKEYFDSAEWEGLQQRIRDREREQGRGLTFRKPGLSSDQGYRLSYALYPHLWENECLHQVVLTFRSPEGEEAVQIVRYGKLAFSERLDELLLWHVKLLIAQFYRLSSSQ